MTDWRLRVISEIRSPADVVAGLILLALKPQNDLAAEVLASANGIPPGQGGTNSLAHALTSAWATIVYGFDTAKFAGDAHEWQTLDGDIEKGIVWDKFKDSWNNEIGRQIGFYCTQNGLSIDLITPMSPPELRRRRR